MGAGEGELVEFGADAKKFLGEQRMPYNWVDVESDPDGLAFLESVQDGDHIVPTIRFERMELETKSLAAKMRHGSRVHLIAPLPSLIHCSAVPRGLLQATTRSAVRAKLVTTKPTRG